MKYSIFLALASLTAQSVLGQSGNAAPSGKGGKWIGGGLSNDTVSPTASVGHKPHSFPGNFIVFPESNGTNSVLTKTTTENVPPTFTAQRKEVESVEPKSAGDYYAAPTGADFGSPASMPTDTSDVSVTPVSFVAAEATGALARKHKNKNAANSNKGFLSLYGLTASALGALLL